MNIYLGSILFAVALAVPINIQGDATIDPSKGAFHTSSYFVVDKSTTSDEGERELTFASESTTVNASETTHSSRNEDMGESTEQEHNDPNFHNLDSEDDEDDKLAKSQFQERPWPSVNYPRQ